MIKVLIVEDSMVAREHLHYILTADPEIHVVALAKDGEEAVRLTPHVKPDVITMDIYMPKMDGLEATRRIMQTHPVPIVIVSANWNPAEVESTFKAIQAGAVTVLEKPVGIGHPRYEAMARDLLQTIKLMSEVRVVTRRPHLGQIAATLQPAVPAPSPAVSSRVSMVAIGSSTGGPAVLEEILRAMPADFDVPILIVQHIAIGFVQGLVDWLKRISALPLQVATQGEQCLPGHVYFAPDDWHMGVDRHSRITLSQAPPENSLRPAVAHLFRTVAEVYGSRAIGVLLTGMGSDGAAELKLMHDRGALTIAQDKATSIVHGMPGEAIKLGAARYILPPAQIAATLMNSTKRSI